MRKTSKSGEKYAVLLFRSTVYRNIIIFEKQSKISNIQSKNDISFFLVNLYNETIRSREKTIRKYRKIEEHTKRRKER